MRFTAIAISFHVNILHVIVIIRYLKFQANIVRIFSNTRVK